MIRALVVDDELPAREELQWLLEQIEGVEVAGAASDSKDALDQIVNDPFDVVFLDIDMPGIDGMRLAEAIYETSGPKPQIVFVTAYQERAVDAFSVDATDYILKPARLDRLRTALDKVRARLISKPSEPKALSRISVEKRNVFHVIAVEDIVFFESEDGVVIVQTDDERFMTDFNLKYLERSLSPELFYRCHRSFIVRIDAIKSLAPLGAGTYQLTLQGVERVIPLARSRASGLKQLIPSS